MIATFIDGPLHGQIQNLQGSPFVWEVLAPVQPSARAMSDYELTDTFRFKRGQYERVRLYNVGGQDGTTPSGMAPFVWKGWK